MLLDLLLSVSLVVPAADSITGTWRVTGDVAGNALDETCTLRQADTVVTGSCKATQPADAKAWEVTGTVKEGKVTFKHGGDYSGTPLTISYTGLLASPTSLSGMVVVDPFGVDGNFTAAPVAASTTPPAAPAKP